MSAVMLDLYNKYYMVYMVQRWCWGEL